MVFQFLWVDLLIGYICYVLGLCRAYQSFERGYYFLGSTSETIGVRVKKVAVTYFGFTGHVDCLACIKYMLLGFLFFLTCSAVIVRVLASVVVLYVKHSCPCHEYYAGLSSA